MEAGLGVPRNALQETISEYNAGAAIGEDVALAKYRDWLKPLNAPPYAAFDLSFGTVLYHYHTLGGLRVDREAAVLSVSGAPIPGLFAAGACAAGIVQDAKGYGSGMTLSGGSFFGRVAGRNAAARARNSRPEF